MAAIDLLEASRVFRKGPCMPEPESKTQSRAPEQNRPGPTHPKAEAVDQRVEPKEGKPPKRSRRSRTRGAKRRAAVQGPASTKTNESVRHHTGGKRPGKGRAQ